MLVRFFYVSEISPGCTELDVQVLLGQAQVRNRRLDVTGMLAKSDGHFCQVLEGRPDAVDQVMDRVRRDRRHTRIRVLLEQPCDKRLFEGWAMGLVVRDDMAPDAPASYCWCHRRSGDERGHQAAHGAAGCLAGPASSASKCRRARPIGLQMCASNPTLTAKILSESESRPVRATNRTARPGQLRRITVAAPKPSSRGMLMSSSTKQG